MKTRILFVDDELKILHGLKRMLYSMQREWDMFFVESGNEALKILSETNIDIIISDMRMPEMDGTELLGKVVKTYPGVIRIILSGYSDQEAILSASKTAHRFLAKPCNPDELKSLIIDLLNLKKQFPGEELLSLVTGLDTLPSHMKFFEKLKSELNSPHSSIKKVGEILSQDITMTAKTLQLVNSAFFGLPQRITDPTSAISLLGFEVVKSLVLFVKIFSSYEIPDKSKKFFDDVYDHSLKVANLAKEIAGNESSNKEIVNEAFTGGLLHDIGKIIFLRLNDYPENVLNNMEEKKITFSESEKEMYKATHCELGEYLLRLWGLPEEIALIAGFHHNPSLKENNGFTALSAVYAANFIINKKVPDDGYLKRIGINIEKYTKSS